MKLSCKEGRSGAPCAGECVEHGEEPFGTRGRQPRERVPVDKASRWFKAMCAFSNALAAWRQQA